MLAKRFSRVFLPALLAGATFIGANSFSGTAHADQLDIYGVPHCTGQAFVAIAPGHDPSDGDPVDAVCTDQRVYFQGQDVTMCYDVAYPGEDIQFTLQYPNGQVRTLAWGPDDGTGDCFQGVAAGRGRRTLRLFNRDSFGPPTTWTYYVR